MARDSKEQMIEGAIRLLATKGLQATSFSEVLALTGAPRGSIYHHFPNGKNQLIAAALDLTSDRTLQLIETKRGESARAITEFFLDLWRKLLVYSEFQAGCSVLAVTIATDSDELRQKAASIFDEWQKKLADLYIAAGVDAETAAEFSFELISASEGAVVLARAQKSLAPFEAVAKRLVLSIAE
ncbi:MAG TPA: TetR/AcrR family transcriptional regulator [Aggregatilineales bacterium]|nr:TetR/AcrR family transcriptional regulator [Aggregatilineales bacterium]